MKIFFQSRPEIAAQLQEKLNDQRREAKRISPGGSGTCLSDNIVYTWDQNAIELYLYIPIGDTIRFKDVQVIIQERNILVVIKGKNMLKVSQTPKEPSVVLFILNVTASLHSM